MDRYNFYLDDYLRDLETIVNIDSGSNYPAGVEKVANFFTEKYAELGWTVKKHYLNNSVGPCVEITNKASDKYDILLIAHMDTVFSQGTVVERPFSIKGDRAYGPGVNDMKSGLLLMYYALKELYSHGHLKDVSVCVALNSDEEISSQYSRPWLEQLSQKSSYVFVLEPARANGALVKERKGVGRFKITFSGVAAHSGVDHEKGSSAINELGHWIVALHDLTNYHVGTTVNVGVVSGGTASNVVADWAQAKVDLRIKSMAEAKRVENVMNELMQKTKTAGVTVKVEGGVTRPPMNATEETEKLCKVVEAIGKKLDIEIKWASTGGGSDGNFSAALGIPTIDGLGPVGGGSHGVGEYLEINSIVPRLSLLKELITNLTANKMR